MKVKHIGTGGTIGGCVPEYKEVDIISNIFPNISLIDKIVLEIFKPDCTYSSETICRKDSREINNEDLFKIVECVKNSFKSGIDRFLITHGTYTMPETGEYLMDNLPADILSQSSIVITGSMYPWVVVGSDAPMNIGASLGALLNQKYLGVKICMNGRLWDPQKVTKNEEDLIFESI